MKLTDREAAEARQRRLDYQHSLAIEGIFLTPEEKAVLEYVDRERMGYEEAVQYGLEWCRKQGLIGDVPPSNVPEP